MTRRIAFAAAFATLSLTGVSKAQQSLGAGSEMERYARVLQLTGSMPAGQWTVRPFTDRERERMRSTAAHPWSRNHPRFIDTVRAQVLGIEMSLRANSSAPQGFNDGPLWSGKGLTIAATGGVAARGSAWGAAVQPVVFVAQNSPFSLRPNGRPGNEAFGDWVSPGQIDLPQRFGARAYGRIDWGESFGWVAAKGITAGASTASEVWGPATEFPLILGNNAGGFPRFFLGTRAPVRLPFANIHGRILWGQTQQSAYGPVADARGFATAFVGSMLFRSMDLEVGASRFAHSEWPEGGLRDLPWLRLFQGFLANSISGLDRDPAGADNQLASLFFRWAPNGGGVEFYGEYGREDRSYDFRDLMQEPDHAGAFMIGGQRAWASSGSDRITVLRGEVMNSRVSHLQQAASQYAWYSHGAVVQGHTQRGQVLGSVGAHGGGAAMLAVDRYRPDGRITVRWDRILVAELRNDFGLPVSRNADVIHSIGVERAAFGARRQMTAGITVGREFNRYFGGDAWNLTTAFTYRVGQ